MPRTRKNPFRPGSGLVPPHRAGHEEAARTLEDRLERIWDGDDGDIVVLHGPRGNGKTVLLRELERKAKAGGAAVRVLIDSVMRGDDEKAAQYLKTGLEAPKRKVKSLGLGAMSAKANLEFEGSVGPVTVQTLNTLLGKNPVLLVIDEAHVMPIGFGRNLLQVAQLLIGDGKPLFLVLAGTPGLRSHLRKMSASFWERSKRLPIGRLESDEAARDALTVPAERGGLSFEDGALDLLVEESQRYPFFLQLLGEAVWDVVIEREGARVVSLDDARNGVLRANAGKEEFYSNRYREAEAQGVLAEAFAVSRRMVGSGRESALTDDELLETLTKATAGTKNSPLSAREALLQLGFIWDNRKLEWEPGIPSLCTYFIEQSKKIRRKPGRHWV